MPKKLDEIRHYTHVCWLRGQKYETLIKISGGSWYQFRDNVAERAAERIYRTLRPDSDSFPMKIYVMPCRMGINYPRETKVYLVDKDDLGFYNARPEIAE